MRLIVAGSRKGIPHELVNSVLDTRYHHDNSLEIVCGMAPGADTHARVWAEDHDLPVAKFRPDWERYGMMKAGPIRNGQMAKYADELVAFWDGKSPGTKNMIDLMRRAYKPYLVIPIRPKS